jgi:hypothetical protein
MISTEELRERRGRFVANVSGDLGYSIVAGFDQRGGLLHPVRDQITVHGLANEGGKAVCERRAAQAHAPPEIAESPRLIGSLIDQLKGLSDVRVFPSTLVFHQGVLTLFWLAGLGVLTPGRPRLAAYGAMGADDGERLLGSLIAKVHPASGRFATAIVPPWASTARLTMASPSPKPLRSVPRCT